MFNDCVRIGPPLWPSGQSSWLKMQRSGFDSRRYQIFWVVGLERGSLSLMSTIEKLPRRKSRGLGLESQEYGRKEATLRPRGALCPLKQALTSPTSGGRSFGIVRLRTQATEFNWVFLVSESILRNAHGRMVNTYGAAVERKSAVWLKHSEKLLSNATLSTTIPKNRTLTSD
jgi:hypothetical protein